MEQALEKIKNALQPDISDVRRFKIQMISQLIPTTLAAHFDIAVGDLV